MARRLIYGKNSCMICCLTEQSTVIAQPEDWRPVDKCLKHAGLGQEFLDYIGVFPSGMEELKIDSLVEPNTNSKGAWGRAMSAYPVGRGILIRVVRPWALVNFRDGLNNIITWYPVRFLKPVSSIRPAAQLAQHSGEPGEPGEPGAAPVAAPVAALPAISWDPADLFRTGEHLGPHVEFIRIGWLVMWAKTWLKTNPNHPHLRKAYSSIVGTVVAKNGKKITVEFENGCLGVDLDASELVFVKAGTEDATVIPDDKLSTALTHAMVGTTMEERAALFESCYLPAVQCPHPPAYVPAYSPVVRASMPAPSEPAPSVPAQFVPSVPAPAHGGGFQFRLNPSAPPMPAPPMPAPPMPAPPMPAYQQEPGAVSGYRFSLNPSATIASRVAEIWAHGAFRKSDDGTPLSRADATGAIAGSTDKYILRQSSDKVPDGEFAVRYVMVFNSEVGEKNLKFEVCADGLVPTDGTKRGDACADLDAVLRRYGHPNVTALAP